MEKLFHFDTPSAHYECDAAVVWCFDARFEPAFRKFLKKIGVNLSDAIKIAGGAKSLASPEQESHREFVMDQIQKSIRLHKPGRVILMLHSDCGAYGGLGRFGGDAEAERTFHTAEMERAMEIVRKAVPGVRVEGYFIDFEGVWGTKSDAATG